MPRRHGLTVLPASGNVGAQFTPAAGWAQAILYRQRVLGEDGWGGALAVALGGEGSIAANGFWSALNIVTTLKLPYLFFIEDNSFGLSVPSTLQVPGGDIASNLKSYRNLMVLNGDGTEPEQSLELISSAVAHIREQGEPALLRLTVPRLRGHTFTDDQAYKSPELKEMELERDPLTRLRDYLLARGTTAEVWSELQEDTWRQVEDALSEAEALPEPDPAETVCHLFYSGATPVQGGLRPESGMLPAGNLKPHPSGPRVNFVEAIRRTLIHEMSLNPRMLVFGEDVGVKGGVHTATLDMQIQFGQERIFDTSLSEEGIIGRSAGLALAGLLPVPEIQFRKYAEPAHEQISDIGTLRWRTANQFAAPMVVRIPVGFGKRTGDPWHSVTAEAIYAHMPGWRIAFPSNAEDAVGLLRSALRGDDPTLFLEHRALLDTTEGRRRYPGDDYCLPFGHAAVLQEGNELCLITWGAMVPRALQAVQGYAGKVQLIDIRTIIPWDQDTVLSAVKRTGKVLIVHEDSLTGGFGAEIGSVIANQAFTDLDAPVQRMGAADVPVPYNLAMMEYVIPSTAKIEEQIRSLLAY